MEGEWSCYSSGQFNGGRMVVTKVVTLMEGNSYVTEVVSSMQGELSYYRGGH